MTVQVRLWHVTVAGLLVVLAVAGALLAGQEDARDVEVVVLTPLPTSTDEPTPTLGWWGTVTFPTATITATVTSAVLLTITAPITP